MEIYLVILAALAPVAIALYYINKKDSFRPEPKKWLMKAFGYGVLSALLAILLAQSISTPLGLNNDLNSDASILDAFAQAFLVAAIPEEVAKLLMLHWLLKKNPYFDERFDGIVYAVCVGMGFAGLENILYLLEGVQDGSWVSTGIVRALFSIPGHFLFAVLMGYYYSLYHWGANCNFKTKAMILIAPVLAHGIYDGILFSMSVDEGFAAFGTLIFLYFFNKLRKKGQENIEELKDQ